MRLNTYSTQTAENGIGV